MVCTLATAAVFAAPESFSWDCATTAVCATHSFGASLFTVCIDEWCARLQCVHRTLVLHVGVKCPNRKQLKQSLFCYIIALRCVTDLERKSSHFVKLWFSEQFAHFITDTLFTDDLDLLLLRIFGKLLDESERSVNPRMRSVRNSLNSL